MLLPWYVSGILFLRPLTSLLLHDPELLLIVIIGHLGWMIGLPS